MSTKQHVSRRRFLQTTFLTASAPFLLPGHVWSAETSPNERIRIGFIGVGTQGRGLLGGFLNNKETQVLAVCDVDATRREHSKKTVEDHYAKQN